MRRRVRPISVATACTLAGLAALITVTAPTAVGNSESGGYRSTIGAPLDVEVGDPFTIRVAIDQPAAAPRRVTALLRAGETCQQAPSDYLEMLADDELAGTSRSYSVRVSDDADIGTYSVCVYLRDEATQRSPVLFDSDTVEIHRVDPALGSRWTIGHTRFWARSLGPIRLDRISAVDARFYYGRARRSGRYGCPLRWPSLGMRMWFLNLGGGSSDCGEDGRLNAATVGGRSMYFLVRTQAGLWLGDRARRIKRIYRHPKRVGRSRWLLRPYFSPIAGGFPTSPVTAIVRGGRVRSFELNVGAAGE